MFITVLISSLSLLVGVAVSTIFVVKSSKAKDLKSKKGGNS